MAAASIQIVLRDSGGGTYAFDVDGEIAINQEFEYKEAANPPELQRITESWEVTAARIVGATSALTFSGWQTFLALVETRTGTRFTSAELRRTATAERTLGPSGFQEFKLELLGVGPDPLAPAATFNTIVPISFRVSAVKAFADGNGIVGWDQTVSNTYKNGLHTLQWRTTIETAEGTSAVTAAQTYAKIPITDFGNTYTWDTNGPDGIDYDYEDGDEQNSRTPTKVVAISKISQWGIAIGTPNAGNSPNGNIEYSIEDVLEKGKTFQITRAKAEGPNASVWVLSKAPTVGVVSSKVFHDRAGRIATGEWLVDTGDAVPVRHTVAAVVTRGARDVEFVAISGDFPPVKITGARQAYRLTVSATVRYTGATPSRNLMRLPDRPTAPWVFIQNASFEDAVPRLVNPGATFETDEWERGMTLVFESPTLPSILTLVPTFAGNPSVNGVRSHIFSKADQDPEK